MEPMEIALIPLEGGHALVAEVGVFAIGKDAEAAQALGQRLYAHLGLPVVPLVVGGPRRGYHQGVLHLGSLEEHLPHLPRVLTPGEVQALARFLEGGGPRPEVRLRLPANPSPKPSPAAEQPSEPLPPQAQEPLPQGSPKLPPGRGAVFVRGGDWRNREVVAPSAGEAPSPARPAPAPKPSRPQAPPSPLRHLVWLPALLVLYAALTHLPGLVALVPALGFLRTQDRLLKRGGSAWDWTGAFRRVVYGLSLTLFLGVALRFPLEASLTGALAWALLPSLWGALALYRPLPLGEASRLYALAWGDALFWLGAFAPLAFYLGAPLLGALLLVPALFWALGRHLDPYIAT